MSFRENYNPNQPVCDNQGDFNQAFRSAIKYNYQQDVKGIGPWIWVYIVIYLIFFWWALMLALKVPAGSERTLHVLFAIVASPAYVLANYVGKIQE